MVNSTDVYRKKVQSERNKKERIANLKRRLDSRITNARLGKEALKQGDYLTAINKYSEYLDTMASYHGCANMYALKPGNFRGGKDTTELLMTSHIYFELAKVYDATGKFREECGKCLDQFVLFSANQPFQVVNSELVRKHIRKFKFKNHDLFAKAYEGIFVQSRKCYVATLCFGEEHPTTERLRFFKAWLLVRPGGRAAVATYYRNSSRLVAWLPAYPRLMSCFVGISRPVLRWFSRGPLRRIIGQ
jgi:hypothetical protein